VRLKIRFHQDGCQNNNNKNIACFLNSAKNRVYLFYGAHKIY
jgi:hypothetical protein